MERRVKKAVGLRPLPPLLLPLLPLLLLLSAQPASSLFLHTSSAVILSRDVPPPAAAGAAARRSLFGYRVAAVRDGADTFLLVSDPVGRHPDTGKTSGTVHKCPVSADHFGTTGPVCAGAGLPFSFTSAEAGGFAEYSQFGASLASLPDGQFVACAPGHNFVEPTFNHTATPGLCAYWRSASAEPVWLHRFFPTIANSKDERMFGNCLGGFQAALTGGGSAGETRLTVSGPFCMLQRLAVAVWSHASSGNGSSGEVPGRLRSVTHPRVGIRNSYLGYSLAADADSGVTFASAPFIQYQYTNPVLLARLTPAGDTAAAEYLKAQMGRQLYEHLHRAFNYIGYASAVVTASVTSKRTALVLGAPYESKGVGPDGPDRGCVFVLPLEGLDGRPIDSFESAPARFCGGEPGGRLGSAVVNIGDVNYDGSDDFAVGCPGCGDNGTGAVYLFLGFADYASPPEPLEPFEVVRAPDVSPELAGFGWSLAVAADLDGNTVDELVVGAVGSGHAVVLPGRLLLDTSLGFGYADSDYDDEFQTAVPIHLFSRRLSRPIVATIDMRTKSGLDLTTYGFNMQVSVEELADSELQKRFHVELIDCPSVVPTAAGWCQLDRVGTVDGAPHVAQFSVKFRLKSLGNNNRHAPPGAMLRDLSLRMRWRIVDRVPPPGAGARGLFPAVLFQRRVFPGYEGAFEMPLYRFTTGVCDSNFGCSSTGNLRLRLLGESNVLLNSYHQVAVTLLVQKASSDPYYGGTALRLTPSPGIHVRDNVTLRQLEGNATSHVRYWSDHKEVLLTEPFPDPPDLMTRGRRGQMEVTLLLNFDARRVSYQVTFSLVNLLGEVAGFGAYVTRDRQPADNTVRLKVNFNTSLSLRLLSATDEVAIADARSSASESELQAKTGAVASSIIGPGLQHTYELLQFTKPPASVRGLALTIRVPLVTTSGRLLLYFPKSSIASYTTAEAGRISQYLPGLPFTSDDVEGFEGNKGRECLPLEADLASLLTKPELVLLGSQHEHDINSSHVFSSDSHRVRRDAAAAAGEAQEEEPPPGRLLKQRRGAPQFEFLAGASATQPPPPLGSLATSGGLETPGSDAAAARLSTFDCDRPELAPIGFRCITFRCAVRDLGQEGGSHAIDRVFLHLHARLWSPTFFREHLAQFNIRSRVSLTMPSKDQVAFRNVDLAGNSSVEQTFLFLGVRPRIVDRIPWGWIILAIFLGIWLLLLFILLLWYCNFFRRKRYEYGTVPQKETNDDDDFYR